MFYFCTRLYCISSAHSGCNKKSFKKVSWKKNKTRCRVLEAISPIHRPASFINSLDVIGNANNSALVASVEMVYMSIKSLSYLFFLQLFLFVFLVKQTQPKESYFQALCSSYGCATRVVRNQTVLLFFMNMFFCKYSKCMGYL